MFYPREETYILYIAARNIDKRRRSQFTNLGDGRVTRQIAKTNISPTLVRDNRRRAPLIMHREQNDRFDHDYMPRRVVSPGSNEITLHRITFVR